MLCVTSIGHTWRDGASDLGVPDPGARAQVTKSSIVNSPRIASALPLLTHQML
jgi:hypothetical protein